MVGHRALYHEGWKAVTRHFPGTPFDDDRWELYHVDVDASECHDLAQSEPTKVQELIEIWWREAQKYGVLPLDDRGIELFGARFRDNSPHPLSRHYTYRPPLSPIPPQAAAGIGGRSWDLVANIERGEQQGGVIMASGTENAGVSLFVQDDHLFFDYNIFGDHHVIASTVAVPVGASTVGLQFRRGAKDADATLMIDGAPVGSGHFPFVMRIISSIGMSIGKDHGSPVSKHYHDEFAFQGQLRQVDIQLISQSASDEKETAAREGMARQ
jgi:arylsulfatase